MNRIKLVEIKKTQLVSLLNDNNVIEFNEEDVAIKFQGTRKTNPVIKLYLSFEVKD